LYAPQSYDYAVPRFGGSATDISGCEDRDVPYSTSLLGWRRAVAETYTAVRAHIDHGGDPADAHRTWRERRDDLFAHHEDSPLPPSARRAFHGLTYAAYDPALRWTLDVDRDVEHEVRDVPTGTDGVVRFERVGRVHVPDAGGLDVWWLLGYGGGVFVPVKDRTSGSTTYGGGRYLLDTVKGADLGGASDGSTLVVDLNFAYQPSCAYDPAWVCPLAPAGNVLDVPVGAGELYTPDAYG
jgi:uncharacterized protein